MTENLLDLGLTSHFSTSKVLVLEEVAFSIGEIKVLNQLSVENPQISSKLGAVNEDVTCSVLAETRQRSSRSSSWSSVSRVTC